MLVVGDTGMKATHVGLGRSVAVIDSFSGKYCFLSNFYPVLVRDDMGISYPSVEAAYQAAKTTTVAAAKGLSRWVRCRPRRRGVNLPAVELGGDKVGCDAWVVAAEI